MKPLIDYLKESIEHTNTIQTNQTTAEDLISETLLNQAEILEAQASQDDVLAEILLNTSLESEVEE